MIAAASSVLRPRYLFVIGELDTTFVIDDEPTSGDLDHARVGTALIIRLEDMNYYGRAGEWLPLRTAILGAAEIDDTTTPPFHALPEHFQTPSEDSLGSP